MVRAGKRYLPDSDIRRVSNTRTGPLNQSDESFSLSMSDMLQLVVGKESSTIVTDNPKVSDISAWATQTRPESLSDTEWLRYLKPLPHTPFPNSIGYLFINGFPGLLEC